MPEVVKPALETVDHPDRSRYELTLDGRVVGHLRYTLHDGVITLIHTEIERAFGGRGLGRRLAQAALDDARAKGLRVRPLCPFVVRFIRSHPAYQDLVV